MTNIIKTELEINDWFKQLNTNIDLWVTDPPYPFDSKNGSNRYNNMYKRFSWKELSGIYDNFYQKTSQGGRAYIFSNRDGIKQTEYFLEKAGFNILNWLIWDKKSFGGGYHWRHQEEYIIYASKGKPKVFVKGAANILSYKRPTKKDIISSIDYNPVAVSAKPYELWRDILTWGSVQGDICADPFAGTNPMRAAILQSPHLQSLIAEAHTNVFLT